MVDDRAEWQRYGDRGVVGLLGAPVLVVSWVRWHVPLVFDGVPDGVGVAMPYEGDRLAGDGPFGAYLHSRRCGIECRGHGLRWWGRGILGASGQDGEEEDGE
jgi:hypothetical protein